MYVYLATTIPYYDYFSNNNHKEWQENNKGIGPVSSIAVRLDINILTPVNIPWNGGDHQSKLRACAIGNVYSALSTRQSRAGGTDAGWGVFKSLKW